MDKIYCLMIGYLCGCFLTADFICKRYTGHSMQEGGPDNPGTASITMKFGVKAGVIVLLGDLLKTFTAIIVCRLWLFKGLGSLGMGYAGVGAVLGHCFPVFRHFHGGKGIAVTGAYALSHSPFVWLITYILGGIAAFLSGYLAIGSAVIAVLFPITMLLFGFPAEETVLSAMAGLIILICHRKNYRAIFSGEERHFHFLNSILNRK